MTVLATRPATQLPVHVEEQRDLAGGLATAVFDSPARTYRYLLTRIWDPAVAPLVVLMLNPSTANALEDDPTIRRLSGPRGFARREGAGGVVVVNLFSLCSPHPSDLVAHPDPVGPLGDVFIRRGIAMSRGPRRAGVKGSSRVVAAWGAFPMAVDRGRDVTAALRRRGVVMACLGTTSEGHPRHPLYLPGAAALEPYGLAA
ncbi:DUF1643 domain-containing protein [Streptomyces sp. NPDC058295]|uniref:DUF1643 domain-containing protein n=1 Tax=Streptomyces sp. NPDC058295 TaxID=3346431 RepID=UPI0036E91183